MRVLIKDDRKIPWAFQEKASLRLIEEHYRANPGAKPEKKFLWGVYLMLTWEASDAKNREFELSYTSLAEKAGVSRRTAIDAMKLLEALGLVRVTRKREEGRNMANVYDLLNCPEFVVEGGRQEGAQQEGKPQGEGEEGNQSDEGGGGGAQHAPPSAQCAPLLVHSVHHPSAQCAPYIKENKKKYKEYNIYTFAEESFAEFYSAYPKRNGRRSPKKPAWRAWLAKVREGRITPENISAIMDDVSNRKRSDRHWREGTEYVPYAARYVAEEHWDTGEAAPEGKAHEHDPPDEEFARRWARELLGERMEELSMHAPLTRRVLARELGGGAFWIDHLSDEEIESLCRSHGVEFQRD